MVRLGFSFVFVSFLALSSTAHAVAHERDVADIEGAYKTVISLTQKWDTDITSFPDSGGSVQAALAIHTDALNLNSAIQKAINATVNTKGPLSQEAGSAVFDEYDDWCGTVPHVWPPIIKKKKIFDALPIQGFSNLILSDLKALSDSFQASDKALVGIIGDVSS